MKYLFTICLAMTFGFLLGQDAETKLFAKSEHIGGYGGSSMTFNADGEFTMSGEGAWIISNFYVGGFGFGSNLGTAMSQEANAEFELRHSAGGFMIGAFSNTENVFALFAETKVAFGDLSARNEVGDNLFREYEDDVTTITPIAGVAITPWDFVQFRVYGGYQFSTEVDLIDLDSKALESPVLGFGIYLGTFNY